MTLEIIAKLATAFTLSILLGAIATFATAFALAFLVVGRGDWKGIEHVILGWSAVAGLLVGVAFLSTASYWHPYMDLILWTSVIGALIVATVGVVNQHRLADFIKHLVGRRGEAKIRRLLSGYEALHDVYVESAEGEIAQIDHLALVGNALLVVETKNWAGKIYAANLDEEWTRYYEDGGTLKVQNPVKQNKRQVRIVKSLVRQGTDVVGIVAFADRVEFPKGTPADVILAGLFPLFLKEIAKRTGERSGKAEWASLKARIEGSDQKNLARRHKAMREERELRDALPLPPDPVIKPASKPSFTNSGKRSGI